MTVHVSHSYSSSSSTVDLKSFRWRLSESGDFQLLPSFLQDCDCPKRALKPHSAGRKMEDNQSESLLLLLQVMMA